MLSFKNIIKVIKGEYPEASDKEVQEAAEEVKENIDQALEQVDGSEAQKDLEKAAHGEDDFKLATEVGTYGFMVMSQRDPHVCETCLDHDGTLYTFKEAKEKEPIPHSDCENQECRCHYLPIPDEETFKKKMNEPAPDLSDLRN